MGIRKIVLLSCCIVGIVIMALLSGCGSNTNTSAENTGKQIVVHDMAGRTITLNGPAKKVLVQWSGSGGAFVTLAALEGNNFPNILAARDGDLERYRADMWSSYSTRFPELKKLPVIGSAETNSFNTELAISLKPDVIFIPIAMKPYFENDIMPRLEKAGIKIIFIDYHSEKLDQHIKTIELIGKVMGKEERAQEIVNFYKKHVEDVQARLAKVKGPEPTAYLEVGYKGPQGYGNTFGPNFAWGELLTQVHVNSISSGVITKAAPINPELILKKNPDIIFIMGANWPSMPTAMQMGSNTTPEQARKLLEAYTTRPGWDTLKAVKSGHVYSAYYGMGREVYDCAAIEFLAKAAYPEAFKDVDPQATLQEFYTKFLPVKLTGTWFIKL